MNLQKFVDTINSNTCIMSVEKKNSGKEYGAIRIVCGNKNRASYLLSESIINDSSLVPSSVWFTEEFYDIAASWEKTLNGSNCLIIASDHDYEYIKSCNPTWYSSLKDAEVHSLALYPLLSGNEIIGYIWARDFDTSRTSRIKSTLELTSFFLASELQSKNLMDRLSEMSTTDMLTGVFNRNSMNNRVDYILGNNGQEPIDISSIGIIYVDLNGLKKANDEDGHAAGDLILKDSASRICEIVPDGEIYRAGGDEFVVFIVNTTENAVKEYYQKLEECSVYEGKISFAVGYSFAENPQKIVSALHEADSKMYSNKESYYKTHPDKAR